MASSFPISLFCTFRVIWYILLLITGQTKWMEGECFVCTSLLMCLHVRTSISSSMIGLIITITWISLAAILSRFSNLWRKCGQEEEKWLLFRLVKMSNHHSLWRFKHQTVFGHFITIFGVFIIQFGKYHSNCESFNIETTSWSTMAKGNLTIAQLMPFNIFTISFPPRSSFQKP